MELLEPTWNFWNPHGTSGTQNQCEMVRDFSSEVMDIRPCFPVASVLGTPRVGRWAGCRFWELWWLKGLFQKDQVNTEI